MEGLEFYDEESMNELMDKALDYNCEYDYEGNETKDRYADKKIQFYLDDCEPTDYEIDINKMYRDSDPSFNKTIILEYTRIIHATELAWKLGRIDKKKGETEFWIPKSICSLNIEDNLIAFPTWVLDFK